MTIERPDLSQTAPEIRTYIEALEAELAQLRQNKGAASPKSKSSEAETAPLEPDEPPTPFNLITMSKNGLIKRTPRHHYSRQRRGGMGIFDLELPEDDPPAFLAVADQDHPLLFITTQARVFRLSVSDLNETPIRGRGKAITTWLPLHSDETVAAMVAGQSSGYLCLVTAQGHVRRLRHHIFKETMEPGLNLYDIRELGSPAAACWSYGDEGLFIATQQGRAIRFAEQQVPSRGCLGIRLNASDSIVSITAVGQNSGVFLLSADGKGIIRLMSGFSPNKAPGSGGKTALKTDHLVGAFALNQDDDIFITSRLSKIIRFQAAEVSTTEGVVQGVHCIALRADEASAMTHSP